MIVLLFPFSIDCEKGKDLTRNNITRTLSIPPMAVASRMSLVTCAPKRGTQMIRKIKLKGIKYFRNADFRS